MQLNTTLKTLDLSGNAIDRSGTEALADALKGNSALEVLHIRSALPCMLYIMPWQIDFELQQSRCFNCLGCPLPQSIAGGGGAVDEGQDCKWQFLLFR